MITHHHDAEPQGPSPDEDGRRRRRPRRPRHHGVCPIRTHHRIAGTGSTDGESGTRRYVRGADNFYTSDRVTVQKVTFKNQYQMNVTGNLFVPNDLDRNTKNAAMVVGHPMGAVKEQSANLYATKLAERGFVTLSLDLSYWGESEGQPRNLVAPDVYTEDFSAAVDYLRTQSFVDTERIGALGVCGSGSFVISAAKIDPRIKAVATVSMYDMGGVNRNGLRGAMTPEMRQEALALAAQQRDVEFTGGDVEVRRRYALRTR